MAKNFLYFGRDLAIQVHEIDRSPNENQPKEILSKKHYNKNVKNQRQKDLKSTREIQLVTYKGTLLILSVDFSEETLEVRKE